MHFIACYIDNLVEGSGRTVYGFATTQTEKTFIFISDFPDFFGLQMYQGTATFKVHANHLACNLRVS